MAKAWLLVSDHSEHEMVILRCLCGTEADVSEENIAAILNRQSRHAYKPHVFTLTQPICLMN